MARRRTDPPSAPKPTACPVVEWPGSTGGASRARRAHLFRRVQLELDVEHESFQPEPVALLAPFAALLHDREVEDTEDLLTMTAQALRAFSAAGFRRVDHWEARPGGWLPLPEPTHTRLVEPVAHLLRALSDESWAPVGRARQFGARLSGSGQVRLDFVLRRVHRERAHAVTVDLWGPIPLRAVEDLVDRVHHELRLVRAVVTAADEVAKGRPRSRRR